MDVSFPVIHTNIIDALFAVPIVMILTQIIKGFFRLPKPSIPTIAVVIGLIIAVLISHKHDLLAGLFMGVLYGNAASGLYSLLKTNLSWYRRSSKPLS